MNLSTIISIVTTLALFGAPISGVVIARIVDKRAARGQDTQAEINLRAVEVDEKEARSHEITVIIEGFTASMENMRRDLADTRMELTSTKEELASTREELTLTRKDQAQLRIHVERADHQRGEMLRHILQLESEYPTPPGPPTRPAWIL